MKNNMYFKRMVVVFALLLMLNLVSSTSWVVGYVNDAEDGTSPDGYRILLDGSSCSGGPRIDFIGPTGMSQTSHVYMVDKDMIVCGSTGNYLYVIDESDNRVSEIIYPSSLGGGYTMVDNLTLNTPPTIEQNYPLDNSVTPYLNVSFNCSFFDLDDLNGNISLLGNFSGTWEEVLVQNVSNISNHIFYKSLNEGTYSWSCMATDNIGAINISSNRTLTVKQDNSSFQLSIAGENIFNKSEDFFDIEKITETENIVTNYLETCQEDGEGYCLVPIELYSKMNKSVTLNNLSVSYNVSNYDWNISALDNNSQYNIRIQASDDIEVSSWYESGFFSIFSNAFALIKELFQKQL
jgi:hypothetical protein